MRELGKMNRYVWLSLLMTTMATAAPADTYYFGTETCAGYDLRMAEFLLLQEGSRLVV